MRSWLGAALFWCAVAMALLTVGLLVTGRGGVLDAAIALAVGPGVGGVARLLTRGARTTWSAGSLPRSRCCS